MESVDQVGFGVCLAIILPMSLAMTVRTWIRRRTWVHTEGKVVSVKTKRQTSGNAQTTVRYRYVDSLGVPQSGTDTPWFVSRSETLVSRSCMTRRGRKSANRHP